MNASSGLEDGVFDWVMETTWQAAVLVGLILLAQWLFRKRLSPAWRYGLWMVLVVRLMMPTLPRSGFSVFNWVKLVPFSPNEEVSFSIPKAPMTSDSAEQVAEIPRDHAAPRRVIVSAPTTHEMLARKEDKGTDAMGSTVSDSLDSKAGHGIDWSQIALGLWLAGVVVLAFRLGWSNLRFIMRIRRCDPITDQSILRLFAECRESFDLRHSVTLIETSNVATPAVCGLWSKRLLLPEGICQRFSRDELRHIFLHELAHLKRRDLEVNWLCVVLQLIHWFNPFIWLAFARMRIDRELATDALVLKRTGTAEKENYGQTIVRLLEGVTRHTGFTGTVGIAEGRKRIFERVRMIRDYRPRRGFPALGVPLILALGVVSLTSAVQQNRGQAESSPPNSSGSSSDILAAAKGQVPQYSDPVQSTETNRPFAPEEEDDRSGTILSLNGEPATGAIVYMAGMKSGVYVQDSSLKPDERMVRNNRSTKTDSDGKFRFKAQEDDYAILVLEEEGFAEVTVEDLSRNPAVRLQPWARIQGELLIGTRPGTNESVRLTMAHLPYEYHPRNFAPLSLYLQTSTDSAGRFSFERVPPRSVLVYHSPKVHDGELGIIPSAQTTRFSLQAGEVKKLTLGGKGRPVIGQLAVRGYAGTIDWRSDVHSLERILPPHEEVPDLPTMSREQSAKITAAETTEERQRLIAQMQQAREEAIEKLRRFYATEEGRAYYFQHERHALNFAEDGTFRVEDVPGGKYRLRVDLREGAAGMMNFSAPRIASLDREIEVPDSPGGRSDEPFDVGRIELQARTVLSVGSPAPDFEVKTVDEKPLKLSDYSGKHVLLDFWAVWCGPCVAETPYLRAAYDAFKDDPRFAMIGLSLDPNSVIPRDYAVKNQLGWIMGFLGDWSETDLPGRYGVEGIPSIFLIGPDGRILAKDLRGADVKAAVEKALGATSSSTTIIPPVKRVPEPITDFQAAKMVEPRVRELIKDWRDSNELFETADTWAEQLRALIEIGKPAVPTLIELLDSTASESDLALRLLGFTLRAIGDARAVPALIRAIPRTLRPPGSDCGVSLEDRELLAYLQQHDLDDSAGGSTIDLGRPVREISAAIEKITGNTRGEQELFHMFLEGGQAQRDLQRDLYLQVAHRWAEWWRTNWNSFVVDPALSEIQLPRLVGPQPGPGTFPAGPNANVTGGHANVIIGAVEEPGSECFLDLDTSRWLKSDAVAETLDEQGPVLEAACNWAAQQGIDVVGTKYYASDSAKSFYALRSLDLQAWEISNDRWNTIDDELRSSGPLQLGQPVKDMLMHYDSENGRFIPERKATFLFITREGTPGMLRIISQVALSGKGVKIEYKCFYQQDD